MARIRPFEVEEWMDRLETTPGVLNIAETCCESISVQGLVDLSTDKAASSPLDLKTRPLTYGPIPGTETLRRNIASSYEDEGCVSADQIVVVQGAIMANFMLLYSLIKDGDHVVCIYPTYQQLYEVPKSLGAEVSLWKLKEEKGWLPDVKELESLVKSNTKMIIINNPDNPFGSTIPRSTLEEITQFAKSRGIILMADEVYRPLFHSLPPGEEPPPSVLSLGYDKAVSTSSMSKAWSLAGIRVGWIATRDEQILNLIRSARNYTTISVSQLDDQVAAFALSPSVRPNLLQRNMALARKNLAILERFVDAHSSTCSWTKPTAGTTAMVCFKKGGEPVDDAAFCVDVLKETKALIMPGSTCFGDGKDFKGYMRVGYVSDTGVLETALDKLGQYVEKNLA